MLVKRVETELIFTRDGIIVRTPVSIPFRGEVMHEEKISYDKLPTSGIEMVITSIDKIEESGVLKALKFKLSHFRMKEHPKTQQKIEVKVDPTFHLFYVPKNFRTIFPGYKEPFILETDVGKIETYVSSAPAGTRIGDPEKGNYVQSGLQKFFKAHPELKKGDKLIIEILEPKKRYRLIIPKGNNHDKRRLHPCNSAKTFT